jgi:hypothetical protein
MFSNPMMMMAMMKPNPFKGDAGLKKAAEDAWKASKTNFKKFAEGQGGTAGQGVIEQQAKEYVAYKKSQAQLPMLMMMGGGSGASKDMLPMLMMQGDGDDDNKKMMMMMAMQGGSGSSSMQKMLPFLLMDKDGDDDDNKKMMMMMMMMGGGGNASKYLPMLMPHKAVAGGAAGGSDRARMMEMLKQSQLG